MDLPRNPPARGAPFQSPRDPLGVRAEIGRWNLSRERGRFFRDADGGRTRARTLDPTGAGLAIVGEWGGGLAGPL